MTNYGRVLRMALNYRATLAAGLVSSIIVAVLWGGNIGALYPMFEVILGGRDGQVGQSLPQWVHHEITDAEKRIAKFETTIETCERQLADAVPAARLELERTLALARDRLNAEHRSLASYQTLEPWILRYAPEDPFRTVVLIVLTLIGATAVKGSLHFANLMCINRLAEGIVYDLRLRFFAHSLRLDLATYGKERTSGLLNRMTTDISNIRAGLTSLFGTGVLEPLKMISCLIGASIICWRLLVFSLITTPILAFLVNRLSQSIKRANRRSMEEYMQLYNVFTDTFNGIQTVQAYTMESVEQNKIQEIARQCWQKSMRIVFYIASSKPVTELLGICVVCVALISGAYLVLNQETHLLGLRMCDRPLGISSLLVFYGLLIGVSDPARKMSDLFHQLQTGIAAADRVFEILDTEPTIVEPARPTPLPARHRRLVIDNVSFHYTPSQPVLCDLQLTIAAGETVAIVGHNGCGKSTFVNLLPRFIDPVAGAVRWDDVDLRAASLVDLRKRIAFVTQQSTLFDDTVMNNIRYGSPQASDEDVQRAAKQAHAHQFIVDKLSDGYQTIVGQAGSRLSGGQRQRIALARAILRDPELLILDEATSQIDIESEQAIHQALEKFVRNRTAIMITHRLSTLALADRILVMDAGQFVDSGSHDELLRRCDLYRRLHEIQLRQSA